ncbi:MAG: TolC family protein, partial [Bacteroides sp.]
MTNDFRRWTLLALGAVCCCGLSAQTADSLPATWDLQRCIEHALEHNISVRKGRLQAESSAIDVKTARAAFLPSVQGSISQRGVNRPWSESSTLISGDQIKTSQSKTSYNGSYGIDLNWTLYNGSRLNTLKQNELNSRIASLNVAESENSIQEQIAQIYIQILYASEALKVNEQTLEVSQAEYDRGAQLFEAGSIAKSDLAQLQAQVSTDRYNVVTAQATLADYKLQLKQLLELDGEEEMQLLLPIPSNEQILTPLPLKADVYQQA